MIVFDDVSRATVHMKAKVLIVRVLRDCGSSVVVHVQDSNAVLKCEVARNSTTISLEGQIATVCVVAYKPPFIHIRIVDLTPSRGICWVSGEGLRNCGARALQSTEVHANAGAVLCDGRTSSSASERAPQRRRICWA